MNFIRGTIPHKEKHVNHLLVGLMELGSAGVKRIKAS